MATRADLTQFNKRDHFECRWSNRL